MKSSGSKHDGDLDLRWDAAAVKTSSAAEGAGSTASSPLRDSFCDFLDEILPADTSPGHAGTPIDKPFTLD